MSRPLRIEYPGAFYHVMNRGLNHGSIFLDRENDRSLFKKTIGEAVDQWKIRIHAFSLMDNHYHLLVETPLPNISRAMRHIDGVYTQRFNRRHRRDGPLLKGRFKSILVQKESYFLELVRYIHLNGVKAKIFPSSREDWHCSHWEYLHPDRATPWLEQSLVLSHFGGDAPAARERLHRFVSDGISKELELALSQKKWPAVLGAKSFVDSIRETYLKSKNRNRDLPQKNHLLRMKALPPTIVLSLVADIYTVPAVLSDDEKLQLRREMRWASMHLLRKYSYLSYKNIGTSQDGVSYKAVQQYLWRNDFSKAERVLLLEARLKEMSHVAT